MRDDAALRHGSESIGALQVLVVEDEAIVAKGIETQLKGLGYTVPAVVFTGEEAVERAIEVKPDLILMDVRLKGEMDGVQAACAIRDVLDVPIVFLTALPDDSRFQPFAYLGKPFTADELYRAIRKVLLNTQQRPQ